MLKGKIYPSLVIAMLAVTGMNVYHNMVPSRTRAAPGHYVATKTGDVLRDKIVGQDGRRIEFTAIARQSCVYVIVTQPNCSAGAAAARQWARRAAAVQKELGAVGWQAAWVMLGSTQDAAQYFGAGFPVPVYTAADADLPKHLSVAAFPVYVILGRDGRQTQADVGADLPTAKRLTGACTMRYEESP